MNGHVAVHVGSHLTKRFAIAASEDLHFLLLVDNLVVRVICFMPL